MPGHYGVVKVTIQNLDLVKIDKERNLSVFWLRVLFRDLKAAWLLFVTQLKLTLKTTERGGYRYAYSRRL